MIQPPVKYLLKLLFFASFASLFECAFGQTTITGRVTDVSTKEPIAFANIHFKGLLAVGGQTDADGYYNLRLYEKIDTMIVSFVGYKEVHVPVKRGVSQEINIEMSNGIVLGDIDVHAPKHRRHFVDTPALYVFRQVVAHKKQNREENLDNYKAQEYQKILIGVVNPKIWFLKLRILRPFRFALENRDTLADGTVSIPALMKEDVSDIYYRKKPRTIRRYTKATYFTGIKNKSLGSLINYSFANVNIYDEIYVLLDKSFVAPFAEGAYFSTYDFFLTDTVRVEGRTTYKLHFVGKSNIDVALKGYAWIDSATWAIKSIDFRPNEHANLNYLKDYNIAQVYHLMNNKTWVLTSEDVKLQATIIKRTGRNQMGAALHKQMVRRDFQFDVPINDSVFAGSDKEVILPGAHDHTRQYWDTTRFAPLEHTEERLLWIHDTIKTVPAYKRFYWVVKMLSTAKIQAWKLDFGRLYKLVSTNNVEGIRLRLGVETNEFFSTRYHIFGYVAYGLGDKLWRYNLTFHFPLPEKNDLWRQFQFYYQFDLNQLGATNELLTFDNTLSFIKGTAVTKPMSIREWQLSLENEWIHGFTSNIIAHSQTFYDIPGLFDFKVRNDEGAIVHLPNFSTFDLGIESRYSYHDQYYRYNFYRYFLTTKSPVFLFNYHIGVLSLDGKTSVYNKFEFTMVHRLAWTLGHTWYQIQAGKIVGKSPYPISFITSGGQSYFLNNVDFNMLQQFEFVTDQYVAAYLEHHFDGYIFNKIPYFNRLKLREILYARAIWGSYSQSNYNVIIPGFDFHSPSKYPFVEAGVGLENILKVLRVDFIWRLTYRSQPSTLNFMPKFGINVIF